jgi:hypothetical protein
MYFCGCKRITVAIKNPNKGLIKYCATNPTPTCKEANNQTYIKIPIWITYLLGKETS